MGADGEVIFATLLLDCGLFTVLDGQERCYRQISGIPLHTLCLGRAKTIRAQPAGHMNSSRRSDEERKPSDIVIVRSRILYGRPVARPDGRTWSGLKPSHVLNRVGGLADESKDLVLMHYIFPRQFDLHNVFTCRTDRTESAQLAKDYTLRTDVPEELHSLRRSVPQRLRGRLVKFVRALRRRHERLAYACLLAHYCPIPFPSSCQIQPNGTRHTPKDRLCVSSEIATDLKTQATFQVSGTTSTARTQVEGSNDTQTSMFSFATHQSQVAAFCQAVLKKLLPPSAFGKGQEGFQNLSKVMGHVVRFIYMRKYESMTMHDLVQNVRLKSIPWLVPDSMTGAHKLSASDKKKRTQLLNEFVYFVFDSLLVPLIATNFYVTESGVHRNRLFFFRHDVWNRLCLPTLHHIRLETLVPVSVKQMQKVGQTSLGYSTVRFLPKADGVRMIANLRRRITRSKNGKTFLGQSVNSQLSPLFSILNDERQRAGDVFKQCTFSVEDLHDKLRNFQARIRKSNQSTLFFAKVDIQSAFDSIPQSKLLHLVQALIQHDSYTINKYAECRVFGSHEQRSTSVRFLKDAAPAGEYTSLTRFVSAGSRKTGAVYNDIDQVRFVSNAQALALLNEHIRANIVRVGRKYYRQSQGIAQGSVLSSLLCTMFYNSFQESRLHFLQPETAILLRLLDDFLLITTDRTEASKFVEAMKVGDKAYGICINPQKSLVNFDMVLSGMQIPKLTESDWFPFCGLLINTNTLEISKNRVRKDNVIANTLTVDKDISVGKRLTRRILSSLRIQLQRILLDQAQNSRERVLQTVGECFMETTMKLHQYILNMQALKRPSQRLLIELVNQLIDLAYRIVRTRQALCTAGITRKQIACIAAMAVLKVLDGRHLLYQGLMKWLQGVKQLYLPSLSTSTKTVQSLIDRSFDAVRHYGY